MTRKHPLTVEDLWRIERPGAPSLSPDGAQAVASVARYSMDDNSSRSTLWLFSTLGGQPRALTHSGDKDGQPRFSPTGDQIAFVAKRKQEGTEDTEAQLYLIAPDGGEARRAATVATGVEAFAWFPDGQRIAFVSWVWPGEKGNTAQARRHKAHKERKETGYVTSESLYRHWDHAVPMGRVAQLHVLDTKSGRVRNLFEGLPLELSRSEPDAKCFDISPDGRRIVFAYDPAPVKRGNARFAIAEIELARARVTDLVRDADWDCSAPRYSPCGQRVAFVAAQRGRKHTLPDQLCLWTRAEQRWEVLSSEWDHAVDAPLRWEDDGLALLFTAEQRGRRHLWRFDLADRRAEIAVAGGCVTAFDKAAGTLVTLADSAQHPPRLCAHVAGHDARRIESFNDSLMAGIELGRTEEAWITGAGGDAVQVWLTYPPGFDGRRKAPLMHNIHGGPHTAAGDNWHFRWNTHAFAAQGFVVAAVNYHGSSSFGNAFLDSITHRWGELELQDIEAATDALLKKPWADPRRVYATGGSYGGYLVAWMNAHVPPGRYAAYVCHAGCFDWNAMFASDGYEWFGQELGAWYWDDIVQVHRQSPHAYAAGMRTPTLVIHGALDYRVPDAQGLAYYNTLKARDVPARLLWFPDENHWVLKPRNSRLWYQEFFAWLNQHEPKPRQRPQRKAGPC